MNMRERAARLKTDIPAVFLSLGDSQTPPGAKILAWLTVAYALSPIDLIPDFIPLLGYIDDIIILPALVALTVKLIPRPVWERNLEKSRGMWKDGKPKKWFYAIPIALVWILVAWLAVKGVMKLCGSGARGSLERA